MTLKVVLCHSKWSPKISVILGPRGLKFGVYQPFPESWPHTKFQPDRTSGSWVVGNFRGLCSKIPKINHISGTTCPIRLKFCVYSWNPDRLAHTKFQLSRSKDAGDTGWPLWMAHDHFECHRTVHIGFQHFGDHFRAYSTQYTLSMSYILEP